MPTNRRLVDMSKADFYPTPKFATISLINNVSFIGEVCDPACGSGWISRVFSDLVYTTISTDLYDRGYGKSGIDFLESDQDYNNIVTNPPYNLANDFVHQGLIRSHEKLCLLLRTAFMEGGDRYETIFSKKPTTHIYQFSERITFYPDGVRTAGSGTTAYAWFVWDKDFMKFGINGMPVYDPIVLWIPPGMRKKYGE